MDGIEVVASDVLGESRTALHLLGVYLFRHHWLGLLDSDFVVVLARLLGV